MVYWGVRTLHVYNLGTLLSAVACFVFPLATSFPSIAACLGLHGFFLGAFPPLQSVILVEYLGLERLTSTFGIMCLVKAFASAAGAPLAGLLFTVTGTYMVPLVVCGAVLIVAAIFHQLMDCWP
ncbi:monocarboxylate transporter 7-like [Babylonia areolata]|uniref:monocarboxylate transporter 7-like n=1 Tax=Babylonia areolata TaxID=304850 RepID=UPI003FD0F595